MNEGDVPFRSGWGIGEKGWDQGTFHGKWVKLGPEFTVIYTISCTTNFR